MLLRYLGYLFIFQLEAFVFVFLVILYILIFFIFVYVYINLNIGSVGLLKVIDVYEHRGAFHWNIVFNLHILYFNSFQIL